ncbi:uncharacterized protein LOC113862701 [Abrus precatorius]|uniref:Uncharacterized protein LOC113862701 n=1 Tax=Abrus precatorius TaxID=3816 RepID=A0A8B8L8I8_ABRPR|nr:uncharacterized protein LOC113862701 [Abrus precatorius]
MGRHVLVAILLSSLILFDASDASFVQELRKLVALDPKDNIKQDPNSVGKKNKGQVVNGHTNISPVPQPQPVPKLDNGKGGKNGSNDTPPPATAPPVPKKPDVVDKGAEKKGKKEGLSFSHTTTTETCKELNICADEGDMVACISKIDSKYLVVLLQNRGEGIIKVKLRTDFENNLGVVDVEKSKTEKVNIKRIRSETTQLTLNAGKGDCVLHMVTHKSERNFFLRLPSYEKILTPVNGAYFLILTVLVFGGTWACCMFRKKRHDEVPYQELEMALPESASATNVESAEGWDQGWDDDWDDNVAVKSPSVHHAGSISANGLTSRSSNKDGWENSWDD